MKDGEFSFRQAYGEPASLINPSNISRMWRAVSMLSLNEYTITDELPFSFLPKEKVSLSDLMAVLRDHYEGTELDLTNHYANANPHYTKNDPICSPTTQYGFVAQLRNYLPVEMGAVMWIAPFRPCIHPFVPWYLGINEIPRGYYRGTAATALEQHFNIPGDLYQENDSLAFWQFTRHMKTVDQEYGRQYKKEHGRSTSFERSLMQKQVALERDILYNYRDEPFKMREKLTMFTQEAAYDALKLIQGKYKGR
jgi:dipeptidase